MSAIAKWRLECESVGVRNLEQSASNLNRAASADVGWNLQASYRDLPDLLHQSVEPAKVPNPELVVVNQPLAAELGLHFEECSPVELAEVFAGQTLPDGSQPFAQAYAGHQFGGFTMLGDGRAVMIGEQRTPDRRLLDLQFKGSGATPFSRRGDGKAALGPMLREYIIAEAMSALGIPTSRSLAVVKTGETIYRETMLKGAILTRVAASHLRVGTFQYVAARQDNEALRALADYAIARHFPNVAEQHESASRVGSEAAKYLDFLRDVIDRQASLVAKWQLVGFIHGVMNTDNVTISGETIDYGPCAFMDAYHPATVFSSIDHGGRYAYQNQPPITLWNLARFAETLLPLIDSNQEKAIELATETLNTFTEIFEAYWLAGMRSKLGLASEVSGDESLVRRLLDWMHQNEADYTNTFDDLACGRMDANALYELADFRNWKQDWEQRLAIENSDPTIAQALMQSVSPAVIPRNHRVEEALTAATSANEDLTPLQDLMSVLSKPYQRSNLAKSYQTPPPAGTCYRTFCGT